MLFKEKFSKPLYISLIKVEKFESFERIKFLFNILKRFSSLINALNMNFIIICKGSFFNLSKGNKTFFVDLLLFKFKINSINFGISLSDNSLVINNFE